MQKLLLAAVAGRVLGVSHPAWASESGYRHIERIRVTGQGAVLITLSLPHDREEPCGVESGHEILVKPNARHKQALLTTALLASTARQKFRSRLAPECGDFEGRSIAVVRSAAWK